MVRRYLRVAGLALILACMFGMVLPSQLFTPAVAADVRQHQPQKPQQPTKRKAPAAQATDITADNMEIDDERNVIVFSGNVRAKRGDTVLTAQRLEVLREAAGKQDDGPPKMRRWVATGKVRIVQGKTVITGAKAVMNVPRDEITVTGNVVVKQPDSTIRGARLVTNLKTNVTRITAGGKQRVRGVFR